MEKNGSAKIKDGAKIEVLELATPVASSTKRQQAALRAYTPEYDTPSRRPSAQRPAAFNPLAWIVDGATGAVEELRHNDLGLSEEFWVHLYAARRESLLAARALVDSLIAHTDNQLRREQAREQHRERRGEIGIEF